MVRSPSRQVSAVKVPGKTRWPGRQEKLRLGEVNVGDGPGDDVAAGTRVGDGLAPAGRRPSTRASAGRRRIGATITHRRGGIGRVTHRRGPGGTKRGRAATYRQATDAM